MIDQAAIDAALDDLVASSVAAHANLLENTRTAVGALWLTVGGVSPAERDEWADLSVPIIRGAAQQAAAIGDTYARTFAAIANDVDLDVGDVDLTPTWEGRPDRDTRFDEVARQIDSHIDSPVIAARWHISEGLSFEEALAEALPRGTKLALGDVNRAYASGVEHGATRAGTTVERYLKATWPGACAWCFEVAARGYRSPSSVPRHDHDKCGYRMVYVKSNRQRRGEDQTANVDFQQALEEAGWGELYGITRGMERNARGRVVDSAANRRILADAAARIFGVDDATATARFEARQLSRRAR